MNQPVELTLIKGNEDSLIAGVVLGDISLPQLPWPHRISLVEHENEYQFVIDDWLFTTPLSVAEQALLKSGVHEIVLAWIEEDGNLCLRAAMLSVDCLPCRLEA